MTNLPPQLKTFIAILSIGTVLVFFGTFVSGNSSSFVASESDDHPIVAVAAPSASTTPDVPNFSSSSASLAVASASALSPQKVSKPASPAVPSNPKHPARLQIPSIGVSAKVQAVGIDPKGNIAAPVGFTDAGWYKYGVVPGAVGTAIFDGHVDNGLFRSGVFKRLDKTAVGDRVTVISKEGKSVVYVVSHIEFYNYKEVPMEDIVHQKDIAQLVLITCAGKWIPAEKTYDQRLIVYATLE